MVLHNSDTMFIVSQHNVQLKYPFSGVVKFLDRAYWGAGKLRWGLPQKWTQMVQIVSIAIGRYKSWKYINERYVKMSVNM